MIKSIDEEVDMLLEDIEPGQINLKSFETKAELNPKVWSDNELKPEIRKRMLLIAQEFIATIPIENFPVKDIIMVGSSASFNWSKYSDLDLHILTDFSEIDCINDAEVLKDYFSCKKNDWNNKHTELSVASYPVELYIQDINEENASDGVYSIKNDYWIKQPTAQHLSLNKPLIKKQAANLANRIEKLQEIFQTAKSKRKLTLLNMVAEKLYETICQGRKDGLAAEGESSPENIVFKVLRRTDHLGMLRSLKTQIFDKLQSM